MINKDMTDDVNAGLRAEKYEAQTGQNAGAYRFQRRLVRVTHEGNGHLDWSVLDLTVVGSAVKVAGGKLTPQSDGRLAMTSEKDSKPVVVGDGMAVGKKIAAIAAGLIP